MNTLGKKQYLAGDVGEKCVMNKLIRMEWVSAMGLAPKLMEWLQHPVFIWPALKISANKKLYCPETVFCFSRQYHQPISLQFLFEYNFLEWIVKNCFDVVFFKLYFFCCSYPFSYKLLERQMGYSSTGHFHICKALVYCDDNNHWICGTW